MQFCTVYYEYAELRLDQQGASDGKPFSCALRLNLRNLIGRTLVADDQSDKKN